MNFRFLRFLFPAVLLLLPLGVAAGNEYRQAFVYVAKEETINGNFYRAGETVQIDGTVNGDVIVAGGTVKIFGSVAGDVIAAGGRIIVTGPVQGNVRVAGGNVELNGVIGKNVTVAGGDVRFGANSAVGYEVLVMAGTVDMLGRVAKDVRGAAGTVDLGGTVDQNIWLSVGERLVLHPSAMVQGDLNYTSSRAAEVLSGATIKGSVDYQALPAKYRNEDKRASRVALVWIALAVVVKILGVFLLGLFLLWVAPKKLEKITHQMTASFGPLLGWGFLAAIATPIAALIVGFTLVGLPIAFAFMCAYALGMVLSSAIAALWLGEQCLKRMTNRHWRGVDEKWSLLLGSFLLVMLTAIPVLGWIAKAVLVFAAFGSLIMFDKQELKKWR